MISTWTPEREDLARRLWGEGKSAAHIARELGGVTRVAVIGKVHRMGLGRESAVEISARAKSKPKAKAAAICAVQGCGRKLSKANLSGVCADHAHVEGRCRCPKCVGEVAARRVARTDRADVRVVAVPRTGTSTSGEAATVCVSLKREPWVTG